MGAEFRMGMDFSTSRLVRLALSLAWFGSAWSRSLYRTPSQGKGCRIEYRAIHQLNLRKKLRVVSILYERLGKWNIACLVR